VPQSLLKEALTHAASEREPEDGTDADMVIDTTPTEAIPTMYRWVSRTVDIPSDDGQGAAKSMALSFSVPVSVIESLVAASGEEDTMQVDQPVEAVIRPQTRCDVEGCMELRKYKMVKDWTKGACGMAHLKHLENTTRV
jgi:Ino eighty subunit 2